MELIIDVDINSNRKQMKTIDEMFCYMLNLFKEQRNYPEKLILSYFFHKLAFLNLSEIFSQFPHIDQDFQRKQKINDRFKQMRKIYQIKYKEFEKGDYNKSFCAKMRKELPGRK